MVAEKPRDIRPVLANVHYLAYLAKVLHSAHVLNFIYEFWFDLK